MPLSTILLWLLTLCTTYFVIHKIERSFRRRRLTAKWGCLPVAKAPSPFFGLGRFLALGKATRYQSTMQWFHEQHSQYGATFEHTILGYRQIATTEPENVKAILATNFSNFSMGLRRSHFYPLLGDGIFSQDGADWSHSRALLRPQFSRTQVISNRPG
jgi:cytochrome P450